MTREQKVLTTVGMAMGVAVMLAVLCGLGLPGPTDALNKWTDWAGKVVGVLVAARVLWAGGTFLEKKANVI